MKIFALIDCNNFYASCERIFKPELNGKPIVILSNNDGCIIARSNEAKALGIPMGQPYHESKDIILRHNVNVFSANFQLYGDISHRVMSILREYSPDAEIYSIDEAFLNLDSVRIKDYEAYCKEIVQKVAKHVGIPISIGIAETKTLAKLGNKIAKKNHIELGGVFSMMDKNVDEILKELEAIEIWGIGYRSAETLKGHGIYTALDFKNAPRQWVRSKMGVTGERILLELNKTPSLELENHDVRKGILSSRSFSKKIVSKTEIKEAIATYISRASEKLRQQGSVASYVTVFIRTDKHKLKWGYYGESYTLALEVATDYTPKLIETAFRGVDQIFQDGQEYKKAGIYLDGLYPKAYQQIGLMQNADDSKEKSVNKVFDKINREWGGATLKYAATGMQQQWRGKREKISKRYTTDWNELLEI